MKSKIDYVETTYAEIPQEDILPFWRKTDKSERDHYEQSGQTAVSGKVAKSGKTFPLLERSNPMMHCT